MPRRPLKPADKPRFELAEWYSSEAAKRSLGAICQAVNEEGETVGLLGSAEKPYLLLEDADGSRQARGEVEVTIDEAKADWSSVTAAALFFGTRFRIHGKKVPRAVLYRNPKHSHPALKYRKPQSPELTEVAAKLEDIVKEIQKLGRNIGEGHSRSLARLTKRLERAAEIIERRFREVWRVSHNLPVAVSASSVN